MDLVTTVTLAWLAWTWADSIFLLVGVWVMAIAGFAIRDAFSPAR